jgi:hypothetical protein
VLTLAGRLAIAQTSSNGDFKLALPEHKGQLRFVANGFKIVENSATPNGRELGIRARNDSAGISFLGFIFLVPGASPLTSAKCRDGALAQETKSDPALKLLKTSKIARSAGLPVALVTYTSPGRGYNVRGFVATADICGDLELYSEKPIADDSATLQKIFMSFELEPDYTPQFADLSFYAQILFLKNQYQAAAPILEKALAVIPDDGAPFESARIARRLTRDQAGDVLWNLARSGESARHFLKRNRRRSGVSDVLLQPRMRRRGGKQTP